jgi:small conductance mechanosensitive channel
VLKDPAPVVGISTLGDSSINISVQPWVNVGDYGPAQSELYRTIVEQFRAKNIAIPFPQSEVRLFVDPTTAR